MDQLALTACVVLGILFGLAVARFLSKGAMAALEAKIKAEAQKETVTLGERVAAKEARLVELTRDHIDTKRRLEEALEHASRLNGVQNQFDSQVAELRRQQEEKLLLLGKSHDRAIESLRLAGEKKAEQAERYAAELTSRLNAARQEADALRDEVTALRAEQTESEARLTAAAEVQAKFFEQNNQAFLDLARSTFERLQEQGRSEAPAPAPVVSAQPVEEAVRPLQDALSQIAGTIANMERERAEALADLSQQVGAMVASQQEIRQETHGLASTLRATSQRGHWTEIQLRRAVEIAGMAEHCDFQTAAESGTLLVHLPNRRVIAVDSATPLQHFLASTESGDAERAEHLREHAIAVRGHLARLAAEERWEGLAEAPELVVAYLPGEAPYAAALDHDPELVEFGATRRVILATPATLIALLRAAAHGWQQHEITESARQISELGNRLYESLEGYQARMNEVRGHLEKTVESYNNAVASLEGQVLEPVRRLHAIAPPEPIVIRPRPSLAIPAPVSVPVVEVATLPEPEVQPVETAATETATAEPVAVETAEVVPAEPIEESVAPPESPSLASLIEMEDFDIVPETERVQEPELAVEPEPEPVAESVEVAAGAVEPVAEPPLAAEAAPEVPVEEPLAEPAAVEAAEEPEATGEPAVTVETETKQEELLAVASSAVAPVTTDPVAPGFGTLLAPPVLAAASPQTVELASNDNGSGFGQALGAMAMKIARPASPSPTGIEGSGYFSAFVKI